jgi:hypothetical protein
MDCPICTSARDLKDRQELVQHMEIHRDNPELMIEKIADPYPNSYQIIPPSISLHCIYRLIKVHVLIVVFVFPTACEGRLVSLWILFVLCLQLPHILRSF